MQSQRTRRIPQSIHSYIQIHSFFQGETFRSCITFFYFPTALKKLQRKELKNLEPKSYDSYKIPLLFQTYIDHIPTLSSFLLLLYHFKKCTKRRILDGGRREKQYYAVLRFSFLHNNSKDINYDFLQQIYTVELIYYVPTIVGLSFVMSQI